MANDMCARASLLAIVPVLAIGALFVRLGIWQLDRAAQKHAEHSHYLGQSQAPAVNLTDLLDLPAERTLWRTVTVTGRYLTNVNILLDNQSYRSEPGYLVYSPLQMRDRPSVIVLVNRGWIPLSERREVVDVPTTPTENLTLNVVVGRPPAQGVRLAGAEQIERLASNVRRVQVIDYETLGSDLEVTLQPYVLLLDPAALSGFVRDWPAPGYDENRHRSYAVQWFAMALALPAIYGVLLLRGRR